MKNFQHIGVGPAEFTFQREFQICPFLGIDPCLLGYQLINIQKSHFPVPAEKPVLLPGFLFRLKPDLGKIHNIQPLSHQHKKIRRRGKRPEQQGIENGYLFETITAYQKLKGELAKAELSAPSDPAKRQSYYSALCKKGGLAIDHLIEMMGTILLDEPPAEIRGFFGKYHFLSNFHVAPVFYNGITYRNNEAAFQAQKCPVRAREFMNLNPSEAKKLGRHVLLRHDWEKVKVGIMRDIVYAKFSQNPKLAILLLATGNAKLFEENTWGDKTWGVVHGQGMNHLGKILENTRARLRTELHTLRDKSKSTNGVSAT